jgi:hypothetical protein
VTLLRTLAAGWPDELAKKSPKVSPKPFFAKINTSLFPCEKIAKDFEDFFCIFFNAQ